MKVALDKKGEEEYWGGMDEALGGLPNLEESTVIFYAEQMFPRV